MYQLTQLGVYVKCPLRSIYTLYFGANPTIVYVSSCDLTLGVSKSVKKPQSRSLSFIWIIGDGDFFIINSGILGWCVLLW